MPAFRFRPFALPLYLRIWLAVVAAVAVLTLVLGWLWSINADPPTAREIFLRDEAGQVLGHANAPPVRIPGRGVEFQVPMADGRQVYRIGNSTTVHSHGDRERLEERLVQRDDRRMYFYSHLQPNPPPANGFLYVGRSHLASGELINLWEQV